MTLQPPQKLSSDECWERLAEHEFGRLAFPILGDVQITPINYAVDGRTLLFRTAQGNKLLGVVMHSRVALEIDEVGSQSAWSVIVRGTARVLEGDEADRADRVPLRPWVGDDKDVVIEIAPDRVTGRRFSLHKPWEHMIPED